MTKKVKKDNDVLTGRTTNKMIFLMGIELRTSDFEQNPSNFLNQSFKVI